MKHIIFDFDGTLVQSNKIKRDMLICSFREICDDLKQVENLIDKTHKNRYQIYDELNKKGKLKPTCRSHFFLKLDQNLIESISNLQPRNGVIEVLDHIKIMGWSSYLSSASPADSLKEIIRRFGWENYFCEINGAPTTKIDYVSRLLLKVRRSDALFIYGDGTDDKKCADAFGIKFINAAPTDGIRNLLDILKT